MGCSVLVTGGAGFIGANFVHHLLATDSEAQVTTLDSLTYAGNLENLRDLPNPARHTFTEGNIGDAALVRGILRERAIDTIVNFAAETHVDRSILGADGFIQTNVMGTFTLLEAARIVWLEEWGWDGSRCRFHHISTDEVYGSLGPADPPSHEGSTYAPRSPYAASKAAADHLVWAYHHTHGLPVTLSNCSNNYGPYQYPEKLIPLVLLNAGQAKPIPIYGDGQQIRDWLYVGDHVEAISLILRDGAVGETYHVAGGIQPTNMEIVERICGLLDELDPGLPYKPHRSLIQFVADRPGHDRRYALDTIKIQRELGWSPRTPLEEGLRQTVQWYLNHPDWVEGIRAKPEYQAWLTANYAERGVMA